MNFQKLIETRFADPVTALDISARHICYGSAMGRIAFYNIKDDKDQALSDSQPELIRGISHSEKGEDIFVSIGDISCQRLSEEDLNVIDYVQIVENIEEKVHKANCERSFTLSYSHYNCVLTIDMGGKGKINSIHKLDKGEDQAEQNPPIMLSNLNTNILENYGEESQVKFSQNTVPFDFDGQRLLWMEYKTKDERVVYIYYFETKTKAEIIHFTKRDGLISHMKFLGDWLFFKYDMRQKSQKIIGQTKDSVLATFVSHNKIRDFDRNIEENKRNDQIGIEIREDIEEQKSQKDETFQYCCVDESEIVYIFSDKTSFVNKKNSGFQHRIRDCKDVPSDLKDKDLFGMGYPYYICMYGKAVACSSDYGVHGERLDEVKQKAGKKPNFIEFAFDPQLSKNGKQQSLKAGQNIKEVIKSLGYEDCSIKYIVSPFIRTLQTAAYLQFGITGKTDTTLITNPSICVKLAAKMKQDPLTKGTLAKYDLKKVISDYLDQKVGDIVSDALAKLDRPTFPEETSKQRYIKGFKDIIQSHFIEQESLKQVIILVSHSDGINAFHGLNGDAGKISHPSYCCTLLHELQQENQEYNIASTHLIAE
ncbi:UNKNOWN [Stylonychia lemnae]|uniref:Phosphoglycerate mutase family protein n=1 Tax=Stylonychia lemnae TaxID=5949 RepID=A0A078B9P0_STYLE|nr:UNKNOWN [Stylonychia lemnae]|eukprot:CDW91154.1 UNKNOWN [Stylonychia lemnae]